MRVSIVHSAKLPVTTYGGTERVIWWLAKGLSEAGVLVTLVCQKGSHCPFATVVESDFNGDWQKHLPAADINHFFSTPSLEPSTPYLVTIEGNGKPGERFLRNTVFVSGNHAQRHGAQAFVYNGIDPDDCEYSDEKEDYLFFLAKASWRVKNVKGAIRVARRSARPLRILGGGRWWLKNWRGVSWEGMVGGAEKSRLVARGAGLIFPVEWNEPFGVAVVEALMSGTPVLASRRGSLPELVNENVGAVCDSEEALIAAVERLPSIKPADCRDWAASKFHYRKMTEAYREKYETVLSGRWLNEKNPVGIEPPEKHLPLG